MFLFLGWGGLITQPLALTFGRRPVYIISQIAHIAVIIWMAFISSSPEWYARSSSHASLECVLTTLVDQDRKQGHPGSCLLAG